jgi:hypothetical protein
MTSPVNLFLIMYKIGFMTSSHSFFVLCLLCWLEMGQQQSQLKRRKRKEKKERERGEKEEEEESEEESEEEEDDVDEAVLSEEEEKSRRRRHLIVKEMQETEESYLASLMAIRDLYKVPMLEVRERERRERRETFEKIIKEIAAFESHQRKKILFFFKRFSFPFSLQKNLLPADKIAILFSNLEELILVHLSINYHVQNDSLSLHLSLSLSSLPSFPPHSSLSVGSRSPSLGPQCAAAQSCGRSFPHTLPRPQVSTQQSLSLTHTHTHTHFSSLLFLFIFSLTSSCWVGCTHHTLTTTRQLC